MYENLRNKNFLQSKEWRKFQEAVGRKTFEITSPALRAPSPYKGEGDFYFSASIVEHNLPVVGKYFYVPRGPIISCSMKHEACSKKIQELINLAKKEKAGWIRIEPIDSRILDLIGKNLRVVKAPHDMQPKETLIMDISKSEEELLQEMKSKTRYNIKLAQKKGVKISNNCHPELVSGSNLNSEMSKPMPTGRQEVRHDRDFYVDEFLKLNKIMSERQGIVTHEENYYRKMFEVLPESMIKLYVAEYDNQIIAANIVIFYGDTAYYLHGASDDKYKNVMAPHLLQWRQIQDARKAGCKRYDFWGISTNYESRTNIRITNKWKGITRFKLGFSPNTAPIEFPGCYDIVVSPVRYWAYRTIQKIKSFIK